jgi:ribosomal protein S27AE
VSFVKSRYNSKLVVMATKHDKGRLLAPHFEEILSMRVEEVLVDTDLLGTFSGEIERVGTPLETALKKAQLGIQSTGNPFGVASEGSVGPDPLVPFIKANIETMVFVDEELGIHIHESFKSNEITAFTTTTLENNLGVFLQKADFPNHAIIVKPHNGPGSYKGIRDLRSLEKAITDARDQSSDGEAIIESDLRAMCSPSRQKNISATALKLVQRLSRTCPECQTPGWGLTSYTRGVECSECGDFSIDAIKQEVIGCVKCEYTAPGAVINLTLDPAQCMSCNP